MHKIRLSKIPIYLIISFIISACSFSMLISSSFFNVYSSLEENKFNSDYVSVIINTCESSNYNAICNLLSEKVTKDFTIRSTVDEIDNKTQYGRSNIVIAANENFDITKYAKVSERTLTKEELNSNKRLAIIGKSLLDSVTQVGSKKYIEIYKQKYEVVGILPSSCYFNHSSIIPYKSLNTSNTKYFQFYFYINKADIHNLSRLDKNKYTISELAYEKSHPFVDAFKDVSAVRMSLAQLIVGLINLILFAIFYSLSIKREMAIMRILGASISHIIKYALRNIMKFATIGIILGLLLSNSVTKYLIKAYPNSFISIDLFNIISTSVICYLISIIIVVAITIHVMKSKLLKEV